MTEPIQEAVLIERGLFEQVVEGLKLIRDIARHDHTGPLNPFGWLVRIDEEAQRLLTQLTEKQP